MSTIRLLALDLDDTLLRSDLSISHQTRSIIRRTEAEGITLVLASSRIPGAMDEYVKILNMHKHSGYLISNNGALVQESLSGNVIHEAKIDPKTALAVCDLADAEGFPVQLYEDDIMYVSCMNEYASYDEKLTGVRQVVVENFRDMVAMGCYKLLIPGDPMLLASLEVMLKNYAGKDISLFSGKQYFLEILPPETNKGTALSRVAELLNIKQEETMAIGDSMNDEAMIRWAGLGVAMSNGDDRIKNIADLVTDRSNDDDGVAEVIGNYILKKE